MSFCGTSSGYHAPAPVACRPSDGNGRLAFYLMCDDIETFVQRMARASVDAATFMKSLGEGWRISICRVATSSPYTSRFARGPENPAND